MKKTVMGISVRSSMRMNAATDLFTMKLFQLMARQQFM
jgi:hypothetical protein